MKVKVFSVLIFVLIAFAVLTVSCQSAKDYIYQNRDLIQIIIKTVIDQLIDMTKPTTSAGASLKSPGITPPVDTTENTLQAIKAVVDSEIFWDTISPKIDTLISQYKDNPNGCGKVLK